MKNRELKSSKYRFKKWFQWLFSDKWEVFEEEMRDLEFERYLAHREECETHKLTQAEITKEI